MRKPVALLALTALLAAGCGSGQAAGTSSQAPPAQQAGAPTPPQGAVQVGQPHTYPDGVKILVSRLRVATTDQLDPTHYDQPAHWKGVLVDIVVTNGSHTKLGMDFAVTVTSDPDDTAGKLATYDGPGSVSGGWWLGEAPVLPGRTKRLTAGVVVASPTSITLTFGSPYSAEQPRDDVIVVGDAR